jgi:DNA-binding transcriptional MerR regulator
MLKIENVIAAFSEDHVVRLTHLSKGRLRYWDKTGFFSPAVNVGARVPFGRVYSFRDIVALRTLEMLRVQNNVPLQHLRKVAEKLSHLQAELWTKTTLWVLNREVVVEEPGTGKLRAVLSGQYVMPIQLRQIVADTQRDIEAMRRRSPEQIGHVAKLRGINRNAVVVTGTRILVDSIRRLHEDGYTFPQIIEEYPDLTEADISAALRHGRAAA